MPGKLLKLANKFHKLAYIQEKGANLPMSFWVKFVQMCQRLGVEPYDLAAVINKESGFNPAAQNFAAGKDKPPVAQGLTQFIRHTARSLGASKDTWDNFAILSAEQQLPWIEKYFQGKASGKNAGQLYLMNFGGFNNPDGSLYASIPVQQAWIAKHPGDTFQNSAYQQKAIEQNPGLVTNGRIVPGSITRLVSGGPPANIKQKIDEAINIISQGKADQYQTQQQSTFLDPLLQEADQLQSILWR